MKTSRTLFLLRRAGLVVFVVVCLLGLGIYFVNAHSEKTDSVTPSLEYVDDIEQQAWQVAAEAVGTSRELQEQFVDEVLSLYYQIKDNDLAILCVPGGWGKEPLAANPEGWSWLAGMEDELTSLGYNYCVIDDIRTGKGLMEYLFEFKEQLTHYPYKAKKLAAKIDFLTQQITDLKIIVTGQSNGAAFAGEVIGHLEENPGVYSIQIRAPFWHRASEARQSLVIDNNGIGADALTERDLIRLFKANWVKIFVINNVPSFTPIDWVISRAILVFGPYNIGLGLHAPGHDYMWEYPGVGPVIEEFLIENFNTN